MGSKETQSNAFFLFEMQKGQESAFDFIFRKYYKALCLQANTFIHDIDKSQSIVQECFIDFWNNRETANSINNLPAYFTVMIRNRCIDHLRKMKLVENYHENLENELQISNSEDLLLTREIEEQLLNALSLLPERSRIAFEYSRFENHTYKIIAQKMDISVKAVEALLSRALKILRKELKDYLPIILILFRL